MNTHLNIGKAILHDYFDFYCEQTLDDAEYILAVKIIINGIAKSMASDRFDMKDIQAVKKSLTEFNRDLYINSWLIQAKEDENENSLDLEEESETAKYYFDYIYEHGEHPR